jgi:hypothetical protein
MAFLLFLKTFIGFFFVFSIFINSKLMKLHLKAKIIIYINWHALTFFLFSLCFFGYNQFSKETIRSFNKYIILFK